MWAHIYLSANCEVLPARQTVLVLVVPHPHLVATLVEVVVWLVYEHVPVLEILVELSLLKDDLIKGLFLAI